MDHADDWVRIEIESALKRGIPVAPVLIDGAQLPKADELPTSLADLAYRNALSVRPDPDFHPDVDRLLRWLMGTRPTSPPVVQPAQGWPAPGQAPAVPVAGGGVHIPSPAAAAMAPVVIAQAPGFPPLRDLDVANLADFFGWAMDIVITPPQADALATGLIRAWASGDMASGNMTVAVVNTGLQTKAQLNMAPGNWMQPKMQARQWLWGLQNYGPTAITVWMSSVASPHSD